MDNDIIRQRLDILFKTLREKEGKENGQVSSIIGSDVVYGILLNRRWKEENNSELTNLEETIASEQGKFVRMYIAEVYNELNIDRLKSVPFPQYDLTMEMLIEIINNKNKQYKMKRSSM